jgi:hypothetical protein
MAWTRIQSNSATNAGSGNVAVAFTTANLTAGTKVIAVVVVSFSTGGNPVTSVKDGAGNTWTLITSYTSNANCFTGLYALDTPAGDVGAKPALTATITTNFGASILVQEVSGLLAGNTTAMCDGVPAPGHGITSPASCGAYTAAVAGEYLMGIYGDPGYAVTIGNSTGWTADAKNVNGSSFATLFVDYKSSTGGAETTSWA